MMHIVVIQRPKIINIFYRFMFLIELVNEIKM